MDSINHFLSNFHMAQGSQIVHLLVLVLVNWIFYSGFKHSRKFLGTSPIGSTKEDRKLNSEIETGLVQKEITIIERFMEKERPYLDPGITLKDLACKLQIPSRKLSKIINHRFNKNFVGFINDYRIESAKDKLKNPKDEKETILEIMYDVGFNSKSSFYTIFKQKTGHTPSEYKKIYAKKTLVGTGFFQWQLT